MPEELDDGIRERAYLCGRLLARYEDLQRSLNNLAEESNVNVTVAERYYSLASVLPQVAFPRIIRLGNKHLSKFGRVLGPNRVGLKLKIERDIAELCDRIKDPRTGEFPRILSLVDQGRFALGYYHQRVATLTRKKSVTPENGRSISEEQESEQ